MEVDGVVVEDWCVYYICRVRRMCECVGGVHRGVVDRDELPSRRFYLYLFVINTPRGAIS